MIHRNHRGILTGINVFIDIFQCMVHGILKQYL
jgi:hypothetical protein